MKKDTIALNPTSTKQVVHLKTLVTQEIRTRIMNGHYRLGQRLSQNQLAQDLNTSRAPVHDALITLRNEGLVEILPQSGSFVFHPTEEEIACLYEASCAYELGALFSLIDTPPQKLLFNLEKHLEKMKKAQYNAQKWVKADRLFHASFVQATNNTHLIKSYQNINERIAVLIFHSELTHERIENSLHTHQGIINHIKNSQWEAAARLLKGNNKDWKKNLHLSK